MSNQLIISLYFLGGVSALIYLWFIFLKPKPKSASSVVTKAPRPAKKKKRARFQTPDSETAFVEPPAPAKESSAANIRGGTPRLTPSATASPANEKLREDLMQLITDLKSVRQDAAVSALPSPELSEEEISSSDVVTALSETLISAVETKGEEEDKRSKLSIDAALLFDDPEEVKFFEKEFSSSSD